MNELPTCLVRKKSTVVKGELINMIGAWDKVKSESLTGFKPMTS